MRERRPSRRSCHGRGVYRNMQLRRHGKVSIRIGTRAGCVSKKNSDDTGLKYESDDSCDADQDVAAAPEPDTGRNGPDVGTGRFHADRSVGHGCGPVGQERQGEGAPAKERAPPLVVEDGHPGGKTVSRPGRGESLLGFVPRTTDPYRPGWRARHPRTPACRSFTTAAPRMHGHPGRLARGTAPGPGGAEPPGVCRIRSRRSASLRWRRGRRSRRTEPPCLPP